MESHGNAIEKERSQSQPVRENNYETAHYFEHMENNILGSLVIFSGEAADQDRVALSSQTTTELARHTANIAIPSVFRVLIPAKSRSGTAFLHKGGRLITASHVIGDCSIREVVLISGRGEKFGVKKIVSDQDHDLALVTPDSKMNAPSLQLSSNDKFAVGLQVLPGVIRRDTRTEAALYVGVSFWN